MYAVASLLDEEHDRKVRQIWRDLELMFHVRSPYLTPIVHISYQVFAEIRGDTLERCLRRFARRCNPITVQTVGLGLFTGPRPVLYIPVVRSPELDWLHGHITAVLAEEGIKTSPYYRAERWTPHITLAYAERATVDFGDMLSFLADRRLYWEFTLDNLALISGTTRRHGLEYTIPFNRGATGSSSLTAM